MISMGFYKMSRVFECTVNPKTLNPKPLKPGSGVKLLMSERCSVLELPGQGFEGFPGPGF